MHWLQALYETYDANRKLVGKYEAESLVGRGGKEITLALTPLFPIFHIAQNAHVTVVLNAKGEFADARVVTENPQTILPATEESEARSGAKIAPHALCDRLMYLAGNRPDFFVDEKTARLAFAGGNDKTRLVVGYFETLNAWADSQFATRKLRAVRDYIARGTLVSDLVAKGIVTLDENGKVSARAGNDELAKALGKQTEQYKALIRWEVEIPNETEPAVWRDFELFDSWAKFRESVSTSRGFCYVSGKENAVLPKFHAARIRNPGDGAKLISSNDADGFTYRGRFAESGEVCSVSAEVSQKAHSALRWLISRQGTLINADFAVVAWCAGTVKVPLFLDDDDFDDEPETPPTEEARTLGANRAVGNKIVKNLLGYPAKLTAQEIRTVFVAAVDSASPGRLALVCYKSFPQSLYFENLSCWYTDCRWPFPRTREFPAAAKTPMPQQIALCAYGNAVSSKNKLLQSTVMRILPCIIERKAFPRDLADSCVARAANPNSFKEKQDWENALAVACAVFRLRFNQENPQERLTMTLDESRKTRDYLYGRLLALGEHLEAAALRIADSKNPRQTKAEQLMSRFALRPYSTWRTIELSLTPYRAILRKNAGEGLLRRIESDIDEVMTIFGSLSGDEDFTNDAPLSGEFLLGYHCQRRRNFEKKNQNQNNESEGE